MIAKFTQILGWIFLGVIAHELYHWLFANGVTKVCYVAGKGFAVYSKSGTGEIVPYIILISFFVTGVFFTLKLKTGQKDKQCLLHIQQR